MRLLYARDTALGAVLIFRGGFELEIRMDGRKWAFWSLLDGTPLAVSGWGQT